MAEDDWDVGMLSFLLAIYISIDMRTSRYRRTTKAQSSEALIE